MSNRNAGEAGQNRSQIIVHRDLQPPPPRRYLLLSVHPPTSAQTSLPEQVGCSNAYD